MYRERARTVPGDVRCEDVANRESSNRPTLLSSSLPGRNYGWPIISYGTEYSGRAIGDAVTARDGMEQPIYYWDPVIVAPSDMTFYQGNLFFTWRGSILVGGLARKALVRVTLNGERVVGEARCDAHQWRSHPRNPSAIG